MIFTIGTSNRPLGEFLGELQKRGITHLVDVRSSPYSRFPWFNRPQIERWAEHQGYMYNWQGAVLGGRSTTPKDDPAYLAALERILEASRREPVAIFCSEGDPAQCHRTWDVGAELLAAYSSPVRSILRDGSEEEITVSLSRCRNATSCPK